MQQRSGRRSCCGKMSEMADWQCVRCGDPRDFRFDAPCPRCGCWWLKLPPHPTQPEPPTIDKHS